MFNGKPASKWVILLFSSFGWEKAASGNHILPTLQLCLTVSQPPGLVPQPQAQYRNEQREYCWLWTWKLSGQFSGVPVGVIKMSPSPSLSPSSLLCPRLTHDAEVPAHSQDIPFSLEEAYETVYYPLWLKKIALRSITPRTVPSSSWPKSICLQWAGKWNLSKRVSMEKSKPCSYWWGSSQRLGSVDLSVQHCPYTITVFFIFFKWFYS